MHGQNLKPIPVVDIFAGPGGRGEGFAALDRHEGGSGFEIGLSIDEDPRARATLPLRAFYRQFPPEGVPSNYYRFMRGELAREELFENFPRQAQVARRQAKKATLGKVPPDRVDQWVEAAVGDQMDRWVLLGGPPCQAYSVMGRVRNRGVDGYTPEDDERHFLYQEYLRIIAQHWPAVFVMENVKGLLSATVSDQRIVHRILSELADPARAAALSDGYRYRIHSLVAQRQFADDDFDASHLTIQAEGFGVPQARHRVIFLGVREDIEASPGALEPQDPIPTARVLQDLPRVRSGLSRTEDSDDPWLDALRSVSDTSWLTRDVDDDLRARTREVLTGLQPPEAARGGEFVRVAATRNPPPTPRAWYQDEAIGGVCNHAVRAHMIDDLHRYLYAACYAELRERSPPLEDFPQELLPNQRSVDRGHFRDRFRVQLRERPARTVTSHISKDGHYYIHYDPTQCRSLTVREAARLQTFPDNYFFCGPRTSQYVQVGNAVSPYLSMQIARIVRNLFGEADLLE